MTLATALQVVLLAFPVSEIGLAIRKRARTRRSTIHDCGSVRLLWIVIVLSIAAGLAVMNTRGTRLRMPENVRDGVALALVLGGLALRWWAILTLGRFFTVNVAVHDDQRVVESGPYQFVRHPSYTGLLLAFLGLAISFGNALSLALMLVPITLAILHRIRVEETVLLHSLGAPYADYARRTKRLIPGIF
jgi:protein-S-isoprenylcysteine O-methyltransferase